MTVQFIGRDKENYAVFSLPDGRYFTASDQAQADLLAERASRIGMDADTYIKRFGPITKEKP